MNDRPDVPRDPDADSRVTAGLRTLPPPPHAPQFWDTLELRLNVDPAAAPTSAAPPPPPMAEVVPLRPARSSRAPRWLAAAAAVLVVAAATATLLRTADTDVETTSAASVSVPAEPSTSIAPPAPPGPTPTSRSAGPVPAPPAMARPAPPATAVNRSTTTTRPAGLTLSPGGLGPLRLGMTTQQAAATGAVGPYSDSSENGTCGSARPAGPYRADDFDALFLNGKLARVYVDGSSRLRTPQGIGVGTPSSKLSAVTGTRSESPHPYGGGTNVAITSGNAGYLFTVDNGTVREWSVGTTEGLSLTEACS